MKELHKVLDASETILWEGKPAMLPYLVSSFAVGIVGVVVLVVLRTPFALLLLIAPAIAYLQYHFLYYALTSKRAVFQSGIIGRDFKFLDYDKITNVEVNVDIMDKIFHGNSGTIAFFSPSTINNKSASFTVNGRPINSATKNAYTLAHIVDPYTVFKMVQTVSHDVKTDIEYPNDLRPKTNSGYQTAYTLEDKNPH